MFRFLYHWLTAFLGNIIYRWPSRHLFVLGVTGTKGKTTVLELIGAIFHQAGKKFALASSVYFQIGDRKQPNLTDNTMPGRFFLQKFLRQAVQENCQYAFVEVTSQGIIQHRHRFINWDAALFLNLSPEHIEAHGSFDKYRQAKIDFFRYLAYSSKPKKYFFLNEADVNHYFFEEAIRPIENKMVIHFSRQNFVEQELGRFYNRPLKKRQTIDSWFLADFNLENAAAAVAFACSQNIDWSTIKKALDNFKGLTGRLEFVQKTPFAVVIDYAHTPDSLEKVYQTLNSKFKTQDAKLICVLGAAGGGRDKWKRPAMGEIAVKYCQKIILTNEDPYDEKPEQILKEIRTGIKKSSRIAGWKASDLSQNLSEIIDRKQAIKEAIGLAQKGDVVIITGKGSEPWLHLAHGKKIEWNERKIVEEILNSQNL